jgi:predicted transcriptional regulator
LLREAITVMDNAQLDVGGRKSLPRVLLIVDDNGRIRGHVRRRDVMKGLEPSFLSSEPVTHSKNWFSIDLDPHLAELGTDRVVNAIRQQAERPVKDVMLPIKGSLNYDDHIITAIYEMVAYGVPLLPVMRGEQVVGMVRSVEVFHELAQLVI